MFHDVRVCALVSLLVLLVLLNAGVSRVSRCHGSWRGGTDGKGESPVTESPLLRTLNVSHATENRRRVRPSGNLRLNAVQTSVLKGSRSSVDR